MPAIHIFKAGTHTDMHGMKLPFTQSDLAACVKAYDPSVHEAPSSLVTLKRKIRRGAG